MLVAVLYLRLSEADDASTSIARQKADLLALCEREGWVVGEILIDDGVSGGKAREKAQRALRLLREGQCHVLAVWKFDRWSRQGLRAVADLTEALDGNPHALFVADRDGLRSDQPAWRIIASVLAEVARMERENTQIRVRSSVAALRRSGRYPGGSRAYGYRPAPDPDGPGRILEIHPDEAAVVREAASRVLNGESTFKIATDFNARGIASRRNKRWCVQTLRYLLVSDAVVGRVTINGELLRDADGMPVQVWDPILDLDTWHQVRAKLYPEEGSKKQQKRRRTRVLSGIVSCGSCGRLLHVRHMPNDRRTYTCSSRTNSRECDGVSINAFWLEDDIEQRFLSAVGDLEVFDQIEEEPDTAALADVEAAISATTSAMASDDADVAALTSRLSQLKLRRAELKAKPRVRISRLIGTGRTFAELWQDSDADERNRILAANVAVLSIAKGKGGRREYDARRVTFVAQPAQPERAAGPRRAYVATAA